MNSGTLARFLDSVVTGVDYRPDTVGGNTFIDRVPPTPDLAVSVLAFGGDHDRPVGEAVAIWQVRVRGASDDPVSPATLITAISAALNDQATPTVFAPATADEATVTLVTVGVPYLLGWDALDRAEWAVRVTIRYAA
jgi:hypothetical protein